MIAKPPIVRNTLRNQKLQYEQLLLGVSADILRHRLAKVRAYTAEAINQLEDDPRFAETKEDMRRFGNYILYGSE